MHKLFILPDALCEFIRALPVPDLPEVHQPETWPEDNTTSNGQTLADMCAPSAAWLAARDAYISHVIALPAALKNRVIALRVNDYGRTTTTPDNHHTTAINSGNSRENAGLIRE